MRTYITLIIGLLFSINASAFELSEHKAITRRALEELTLCLQPPTSWKLRWRIVTFEHLEDLVVFRKWFKYSHYFDPDKPLQLMRDDAASRLEKLEAKMAAAEKERRRVNAFAGVLHYLQDMASPPHVIPVKHGPLDGFEGFEAKEYFSRPAEAKGCEALTKETKPTLLSLLQETARATLKGIPQKFSIKKNSASAKASWEDFFIVSSLNDYGEYGALGNNFGKEKFTVGVNIYEVPKSTYTAYKEQQFDLAVSVTKRALYHYLISKPPASAPAPQPAPPK